MPNTITTDNNNNNTNTRGLHGLACGISGQRHECHSQLIDILWRAFKRAQVPAVKEPAGLSRDNGKRPDGVMLLPWTKGKPLAWDVTVPDTYADPISLTRRPQQGRQLTRRQATRRPNTGSWPTATSSCRLP